MDLMEEIKSCNPNTNLKLLEERTTTIRENQEAIRALENSWNMEESSQIQVPQDREEGVPSSPQQSSSSRTHKPRETSFKDLQLSLVVSRRRKGAQGKIKPS
ncbi:hypothetical protein O181_039693 [Austropuccinia psidii MF-1]|uniref:Uncharacterized protein n=1 Tax=Austropuccinia psidii MF-1 TaxID=1389203 RepID=A0A9Q3DFS0_9BASI|nr:hypothetical protein [Austropuccinia psidii MF-1]